MVAALAVLARRLRTPYPIVLVLAGLALSFVPGIPKIGLDPQVVFFVILPPLVYSAAWLTSWTSFSHHLVSIASLAVGLVVFTVFGVAFGSHHPLGRPAQPDGDRPPDDLELSWRAPRLF